MGSAGASFDSLLGTTSFKSACAGEGNFWQHHRTSTGLYGVWCQHHHASITMPASYSPCRAADVCLGHPGSVVNTIFICPRIYSVIQVTVMWYNLAARCAMQCVDTSDSFLS